MVLIIRRFTVIDEGEAVTSSPHLCRSTGPLDPATIEVPLLRPINHWGALPDRHPSLAPHGQTHLTRGFLAGDPTVHRIVPVRRNESAPDDPVAPVPVDVPAMRFDRAAAQRARKKRGDDLDDLAGVGEALSYVDQRIAELQHRVDSLFDEQT